MDVRLCARMRLRLCLNEYVALPAGFLSMTTAVRQSLLVLASSASALFYSLRQDPPSLSAHVYELVFVIVCACARVGGGKGVRG